MTYSTGDKPPEFIYFKYNWLQIWLEKNTVLSENGSILKESKMKLIIIFYFFFSDFSVATPDKTPWPFTKYLKYMLTKCYDDKSK